MKISKNQFQLISAILLLGAALSFNTLYATGPAPDATCVGASDCRACSQDGLSCGVCRQTI